MLAYQLKIPVLLELIQVRLYTEMSDPLSDISHYYNDERMMAQMYLLTGEYVPIIFDTSTFLFPVCCSFADPSGGESNGRYGFFPGGSRVGGGG